MINHINYILLDAAKMEQEMDQAKRLNPDFDSLYRGSSEEDLHGVAPYLLKFNSHSNFAAWYFQNGWGDAWGILCKSSWPMNELHKHFRKFLIVQLEDGEELYFRFYDPRVFRAFLPTCDANQIREFFGPISYFIVEDEDPTMAIHYWQENGALLNRKIPRAEWQIPDYVHEEIKENEDEKEMQELLKNIELEKTIRIENENKLEQEQANKNKSEPFITPKIEPQSIQPQQEKAIEQSDTEKPNPNANTENKSNKSKWNLFD
jgi:Domain of unknown function (DUF4123)